MLVKIARNSEVAWDIQDKRELQPRGWVQWKGTDVCMDVHCACGEQSHVDGIGGYHVRCPAGAGFR